MPPADASVGHDLNLRGDGRPALSQDIFGNCAFGTSSRRGACAVNLRPIRNAQSVGPLRDLGVGIALDDFGIGYCSLSYLRQLRVTGIKIDRSFVEHISEEPGDLAISAAVTGVARALGLRTTGEGIETLEQRAILHQLGCTSGQGYLWSKALPPHGLEQLLRDHPAGFGPAYQQTSDRAPRGLPVAVLELSAAAAGSPPFLANV